MSKRGGGKSHENKRHEQLSLFDILLENDDQGFSCAAPAGEEQATLYNFEDESEIRHKIGATDRRSESALQSGFEGDNVTRTNREFTSSEIYDGSTESDADSQRNYDEMVTAAPHAEEKALQRFCLNINDDRKLNVQDKIIKNVEAIELLKSLKQQQATQDEQKKLSLFSGWGGCPQVFDDNNEKFEKERSKLKSLLSIEEYQNAKATTLTSFYTPLIVIENMYRILKKIGFQKGTVLETSIATGNFIGMMQEQMFNESAIYGIEIDSVSASIARQLYPGIEVLNKGFEECPYPDDCFDLAISNVPFGTYQLHDVTLNKFKFKIHNYFFAKALQKIRNGGLIAFITSADTMDGSSNIMEYINDRADFLGAIRLPSDIFMKNGANALVTSDIIFLRRNDDKISDPYEISTEKVDYTEHRKINKYFVEHPEMVFGNIEEVKNQYGGYEIQVVSNKSIQDYFDEVLPIFQSVYQEKVEIYNESIYQDIDIAHNRYPINSYFVEDSRLYYRDDSSYYLIQTKDELKGKDLKIGHVTFNDQRDINKVKHMIQLVDKTITVIDSQVNQENDNVYIAKRDELNECYDIFVIAYGALHKRTNLPLISDDPRAYILHSLETYDSKTKKIDKASIFRERTIKPKKEIKDVEDLHDALLLSLDNRGEIDLRYIAHIYNKTEKDVESELLKKKYAFFDPESNEFVLADEYLSGNIRKKIKIANQAGYHDNVKSLEQVLPEEIKAEDIKIQLGSNWVPDQYVTDFVNYIFEHSIIQKSMTSIVYEKLSGEYIMDVPYLSGVAKTVWGVAPSDNIVGKRQPAYTGYDLLSDVLNSRIPTIRNYWTVYDNELRKDVVKSELNIERTTQARDLEEKLNEAWEEWIFSNYERKHELEHIYNELFNNIRLQEYDGSYLSFPEMNPAIQLEGYQKNAVARIMKKQSNTLLWQGVGAGKTFEMIAAGMEMKRLGLRNKILYVVPNHLIQQWHNDFLTLYPRAHLLVATKKDFLKDKRQMFINKIATGNYDAIIMAHSSFQFLSVSSEYQIEHMNKEIAVIENAIEQLSYENDKSIRTKRVKILERTKKSIEKNVKSLTDIRRDNNLIPFDKLGIDYMFLDESHEFKNLYTYTAMRNVAGLQTQHSQKASDMLLKVKLIEETGGNVCFATGTPVTNTMAELYTIQRYLQEDTLHDMGIYCFDGWAKVFGKAITSFEISVDGSKFVNRTRFCKFFNIQELMTQIRSIALIQTPGMLRKDLENSLIGRKEVIPPKHIGGKPQVITIEPSQDLEAYIEDIVERTEAIHNNSVDSRIDNMLKVTSDSKKASIDMRLIDPTYPDDDEGKLSIIAKKIVELYYKYNNNKATQLVFCDSSTPSKRKNTEEGNNFQNVYVDMKNKLIKGGIIESEIAFIHDFNTEVAKDRLFKDMNDGNIRVLFGSTAKLGAGTNVQKRIIAIHHVDVPWRASDIEQQNGRAFRQGNMYKEIYEFRYVTRKSFDAYSWQMVETKSSYMTQLLEGSVMREIEEDLESSFSYSEVKAIASGNPIIKEKFEVDSEIKRIENLKKQYLRRKYKAQDDIVRLPNQIIEYENKIQMLRDEWDYFSDKIYSVDDITEYFHFTSVRGRIFRDMKEAWEEVQDIVNSNNNYNEPIEIGKLLGKQIFIKTNEIFFETPSRLLKIDAVNPVGRVNFSRIIKSINQLHNDLIFFEHKLEALETNLCTAQSIVSMKFEYEDEYSKLRSRQKEIDRQLEIKKDTTYDLENEEEMQESGIEV